MTARVKYILWFRNRSQEDNEGRSSTQVGDLVGELVGVCVGGGVSVILPCVELSGRQGDLSKIQKWRF